MYIHVCKDGELVNHKKLGILDHKILEWQIPQQKCIWKYNSFSNRKITVYYTNNLKMENKIMFLIQNLLFKETNLNGMYILPRQKFYI